MMARVTLLYFASLRDAAGAASETLETDAADLAALYAQVRDRHGFALPVERLRVAVDGDFARWADPVREGAEVAFIPPVSGG
ncbi:MoaD/ThiS family protein [uncultured Luteimonas sp.]|uniref:MoaD/ThiS family protein n=1 Tax=uncultured Luteimonas sp. TaxID=453144 RepID=UPI0026375E66|nr:MoaD/ThiS family protein [uncultured Luteimonas sp.]